MGRKKNIPDATVLNAARAAFAQFGHAASTRLIADLAGISQATLFQRFGDKHALFLAATCPDPLPVDRILGPAPKSSVPSGAAHIAAVALRLHTYLVESLPAVLQLAQSSEKDRVTALAELGLPALASALEARLATLQQLESLPNSPTPAALTEALLVYLHGLVLMGILAPSSSPSDSIHRFVRTLLPNRA